MRDIWSVMHIKGFRLTAFLVSPNTLQAQLVVLAWSILVSPILAQEALPPPPVWRLVSPKWKVPDGDLSTEDIAVYSVLGTFAVASLFFAVSGMVVALQWPSPHFLVYRTRRSDECRVNCCGLSRVNMTLGVCWVVTLSVLMFSRDVSRILIALGVMLAHLVAVILLRCQFSAFGYPLERNVVAPITREQELRMLQQSQPLPEHCAWGRSAPPLHYIAWVGIPHPDVMTPTITEPTAEGAVLGIPITFENGWPVHSPDEPSDDDEDGQGSSCGARDPRQTSLLQSCSSSGSCRNADADRDRPHLLSPRLMAMSRAEPEELRAPGLARMSSMSSSGDGNAFSNGPVLGGAPGAAAPALPGETD